MGMARCFHSKVRSSFTPLTSMASTAWASYSVSQAPSLLFGASLHSLPKAEGLQRPLILRSSSSPSALTVMCEIQCILALCASLPAQDSYGFLQQLCCWLSFSGSSLMSLCFSMKNRPSKCVSDQATKTTNLPSDVGCPFLILKNTNKHETRTVLYFLK